jgi:hypothetical protein
LSLFQYSERPHLLTKNDDRANKLFLLEHGHSNKSTSAGEFDGCDAQWLALSVTRL